VVSKLLFILLIAHIPATAAAWFWWTDHTRSRHQAEIDAIHARGEPVTREEIDFFRQGQLPPEQNAFTLYRQANEIVESLDAAVHDEKDAWASVELLITYPAWRREHADETVDFLNQCQPALNLVRQARSMDGVPLVDSDSIWDVSAPNLRYTRQLAKLCQLAAATAHDAGDDREAFEHLRDILHLRDLIGEHPTLISSLVQVAVTALAAGTVEQIVPTLQIGDGPGEVSAAEVRELAGRLMRSEPLLDVAHKGMIAERVFVYEIVRSEQWMEEFGGMDRLPAVLKVTVPHVMDANLAAVLRYFSVTFTAERTAGRYNPDYAITPEDREWRRRMIDFDSMGFVQKYAYLPFNMIVPSLDKVYVMHYRGVVSQRMAGLALLMRLHDVETGRPVDTLDDLVPRYLSALPEDPFSPAGDPPRHIAEGPHPRLYSLNDNQQDDGGDSRTKKGEFRGDLLDWPFYLNDTRVQAEQRPEQPKPSPTTSRPPAPR